MAYKTPGVYIVEKNAFPNSVVEVETAVPAFIGYTEKADNKGVTLAAKPWRLTSMAQFVDYYGGPPPTRYKVAALPAPVEGQPVPEPDFSVPAATPGDEPVGYSLTPAAKEQLLYYSMQLFFQNGGGPCYVVSIGRYKDTVSKQDMLDAITALKKEAEPTMLIIPEAVQLDFEDCIAVQQAALTHCGADMKNRFAILDIHRGFLPRTGPGGDVITAFRDKLGVNNLNFGAAYYPWVDAAIVSVADVTYDTLDLADGADVTMLKDLLKADLKVNGDPPDAKEAIALKNFNAKLEAVNSIDKQWKIEGDIKTQDDIDKAKLDVHQLLAKFSPLYVALMTAVAKKLNRLPPSAAMAGQYTAVDKARGVWKAPANVSLNSVSAPAVNINHEEQGDLNVTTGGKSVNAIRSFIGAGTLVWGARTLDGNSLDWRYINVRRTMIMLEESIRLATTAYVFEPNVANTWVTIKGMIRNFLTSIWKRGGLAGASPDDAFEIYCGLGETMTAEDILEGLLNVTVKVALSRPAEFIEITFQQQMQKS